MSNSKSSQKRVVIVGEGALFDDAIVQLLRQSTDLHISHTIFSDQAAFLNVIRREQPNMVLVCDSGSLDAEQVIDSISVDPMVIGLCILVMCLRNNVVDVYERPALNAGEMPYRPRRVIASTADDLIGILRENVR